VERLPSLPRHDVVLFVPRQTIDRKTARMFAALDAHPFDSGTVASQFVHERPKALQSAVVFNAFERVAFDMFPWLAALWRDIERRTGEVVHLAGAGPCLFWIGRHGGERVAKAAARAECQTILTSTVNR
jgi:4-diphosphocytidyl-2-C-methyl-D-erythritol kinase